MERALDLAWRGWGRVHPNPMVGAVVLAGDRPVAEGWHAEFGREHAEVVALAEAGPLARGSTLVVTLEPCRHHGKQPPCVGAITAAGVRRVVIGAADPSPEAGGGAGELAAAGIDVAWGAAADAVRGQNAAFFHRQAESGRPFVALKLATSVDGAIADAGGRSRWLSGPEAREYVQWLRAGFDAIAVGGETARRDDPALTARGTPAPRRAPARVIFTRSGRLDPSSRVVRTAREVPTTLVVSPGQAAVAEPARAAGVEVLPAGGLAEALGALDRAGVQSLLVEGGGDLAGQLLEAGLVDRLYWIQAPLWLGAGARPAFGGLGPRGLDQVRRWRPVERRALGDDTLLVLDRGEA